MKLLPEQTLTGFIIEQKWILKNKGSTQSRKFHKGIFELWYDGVLHETKKCYCRYDMEIVLRALSRKVAGLPKEKYIIWIAYADKR